MIEFAIDKDGNLQIVQRDISPTTYLDPWAFRKFSENTSLATQLTAALELCNGTFALSWLNFVKFTKVSLPEQARSAEDLLEANLPRVFFMETNPFTVIQREDELLAGGSPLAPHADTEFLELVAGLKPKSLAPFTVRGLFRDVQESRLAANFDRLADSIIDRTEDLRREIDRSSTLRSAVMRPPRGISPQRGTRFIFREMARTLLIDRKMKLKRSHAVDLMHAIVPIAYCVK
jgi:hypothetical protein